ncbi:hypothetical protein MKQ70_02545 [Chitinophaga sedimenti]|nr:hypothetical protein [Chitinophaga sedimenti]MCK7553946.1 hypothetical protein [Chitinophaga sedimenti]
MKYFPDSALVQLEFDKIRNLLEEHCKTELGKQMAGELRLHTHIDYVKTALQQAHEYKQLILLQEHFPNDYVLNLRNELRLLNIRALCSAAISLCNCVSWPKACTASYAF